jgi:hypothetical protein
MSAICPFSLFQEVELGWVRYTFPNPITQKRKNKEKGFILGLIPKFEKEVTSDEYRKQGPRSED